MTEINPTQLKDIIVIYHGNCYDGFGAAYAAWKKFGDEASYFPSGKRDEAPEGLTNKEVYILDYSYPFEVLKQLTEDNKSVVVIDHHISAKETVESFPQNIFNNDHSGAVLAWQYFHPDEPVPEILLYIEDHDLWRMSLPDHLEFNAALHLSPLRFTDWDNVSQELTDPERREAFIRTGKIITYFEDTLINQMLAFREKVLFAGKELYAINTDRLYRSIIGNKLAELNQHEGLEAIGIVYYRLNGAIHVSLRSIGDTDVAAIAQKYGGGGHKNAAAFRVASFADLPFEFLNSTI